MVAGTERLQRKQEQGDFMDPLDALVESVFDV